VFQVADIFDEAKKIVGACDDALLFRWLGDVVTMISNKADFEGWKGTIDICTRGCSNCGNTCNRGARCGRRCVTLPREVQTVLGVNIGGHPSLGLGQLFNFHLNGPGDCKTTCEWEWQDQGDWHVTYRDLAQPARLISFLQTPADNGKQLIVYGYDDAGNVLRHQVNGVWENGLLIPTIFGVAVPDSESPLVARITGVFKDITVGTIRLGAVGETISSLAVYEPDEQLPQYRRIKLNRSCNWVRIAYRRTTPIFSSKSDRIPLRSRLGFLLGVQARKHYKDLQIGDAHTYEADAARLELEAQSMIEPNVTYMPLQVIDRSNPRAKDDYDIR